MLGMYTSADDDKHPDAHACRLKLRLAFLHSPITDWPVVADKGTTPTFAEDYTHLSQTLTLTLIGSVSRCLTLTS